MFKKLFLLKIISFINLIFPIYSIFEIHLIPHSHMDPGWGWTVDQYYNNRVTSVYDNVHDSLKEGQDRTFVICEMIFFKRWYESQNKETKLDIKRFVSEKRIEFVGSGWVMHDEANSFYQDMIDQLRLGLQFVKDEFNVTVETAWSLDPFGHSSGNVYVLSQLGYKQIVIDRINYQDKANRIKNGDMEFIFKPFNNTNGKELMYHVLGYHYGVYVCDYCYNSNPLINEREVQMASEDFVRTINSDVRKGYKTKNLYMHLIGGDFHYNMNSVPFIRMENVIKYLNSHEVDGEKIKILFSTPAKYFKRLKEEQAKYGIIYKVEEDMDFYTYAERPYSYWSGYFSSRPYLKGIIRKSSNTLVTSSKIIGDYLINNKFNDISSLKKLHGIVSNLQHHDAITGTSNQYVNEDFINMAKKSINSVDNTVKEVLKKYDEFQNENLIICMSNPIIDYGCQEIFNTLNDNNNNNKQIEIGLINPLIDQPLLITIEFINEETENIVIGSYGNLRKRIKSDFYCIKTKEFGYKNKCFLSFIYKFHNIYLVEPLTLQKTENRIKNLKLIPQTKTKLINNRKKDIKSLEFDPENLHFNLQIVQKGEDKEYNFSLIHARFTGQGGNYNTESEIPAHANNDGMYVFSPREQYPNNFEIDLSNSYLIEGTISTTVILRFKNTSYLIATFYYSPLFLKVDHFLDPIRNSNGYNYIFKIESDIKNNVKVINNENDNINNNISYYPEYWTDSNGMQMMRRFSMFIPKYKHNFEEKVSINFYPVSTAISIRENEEKIYTKNRYESIGKNDRMITVFNDKPQAGGALKEGEILLIIDRNSFYDDGKGIGQNLFEENSATSYFKISHILMFGNSIYPIDEYGIKSLQFMYNFFHNSPFYLKTENNKKISFIKSKMYQIFTLSNNVIFNLQLKEKEFYIIQFYCNYDYYFSIDYNNLCTASINIDKLNDFDIKIDSNGAESINTEFILSRKSFPEFFKNKNFDIFIRPNDFVFLYLKKK